MQNYGFSRNFLPAPPKIYNFALVTLHRHIIYRLTLLTLPLLALTACMDWDYVLPEELQSSADGLFIVCEGNFQYGNATLSYYDPATYTCQIEAFIRANGFKLGDVAQSMTIHNGRGWVVVNNSHVVFCIDPDNFVELGRITGLTSPRYMHFISDTKAYITQLWDNRIFIVNPSTYTVTGHITVPDMTMESGSTEQMVQLGEYVYVNCWSYQNRILKIDTRTDSIVGQLAVGIQPQSLALDAYGKLWTICDGGYEGSPFGHEAPCLFRIDAETLTVEQRWDFPFDHSPTELQTNDSGTMVYWLDDDVWRMDVTSTETPSTPVVASHGTLYYGLTVSPFNGDIYVADAIDYQQAGLIYRYSAEGELIDQFYVGIIPGAFCWQISGND